MFKGCITAMVTPMQADGRVDYAALQNLVERQIRAGVSALVINGTTGESPTLTASEKTKIIQQVVQQVGHRVPVIAGTGSYSTQKAIEETKAAMQSGVDACLLITPYYNKPTQKGLYTHYKTIADAVPIPLILYNQPGRTGCDLLPKTVAALSVIANIVALKEGMMTLSRIEALIHQCGDKIDLLTGNDEDALSAILLGFRGVISVTANIVPGLMQKMCDAALARDFTLARQYYKRLSALNLALFVESSPIPCKWLMQEMGLIPAGIRLPLTPLAEEFHDTVRDALKEAGDEG